METITLQYSESIKEKLMNFLSKFSTTDLEIVDEQYEKIKKEAQEDYEYLNSPDVEFYSFDEAIIELEKMRME